MTIRTLAMPWAAGGERQYCLPSSLMLKVALGEAPEDIPAIQDVKYRARPPAQKIDGGPVDRIVRSMAGGLRAARLHASAANAMTTGKRHLRYDSIEQATGVARTFLLRVPYGTPVGALCDSLSQITTVESASPNYVSVTPFEAPIQATAGDLENAHEPRTLVRADEALAYEPGDGAVLLGLIDSGVSPGHSELAHALRAGYDTVRLTPSDVAQGVKLLGDFQRNDTDPTDRFVGHGMGCAGIIAAAGQHMPVGLGGQAQIIPLRALGAARLPGKNVAVGLGAISDLDMAAKLAVDLNAKIINMSFGTDDNALSPNSPKPHSDVVEYALARGCVLIAASGNNGARNRYWPAAHPGVIATGAVDNQRRPTHFTTRGDHIALSAPGEKIFTTGLTGYQLATGTSFAAPFVAATAALLVARAARRAVPLTGAMAKDILVRSVQPFSGEDSEGCGAGILDAAEALKLLDTMIDRSTSSNGGADDR